MSESIDVIVIGSGVAGAALVTRLLESNPKASIVMLEAGSKIKMRDYAMFQSYLVTNKLPQDSRSVYDAYLDLTYPDQDTPGENVSMGDQIPLKGARMMAYGGSTGHWGGWSFRMKPEDFKLKTQLAAQQIENEQVIDWPITYDQLEEYYCKAEQHLGVSGDSQDTLLKRSGKYPYKQFPYTAEDGLFIEAFKQLSVGYSHLPIARYGVSDEPTHHVPCQTTGLCKYCPFGARYAAANDLDDLKKYKAYPNFQIRLNVVVEEIAMASKETAAGVKCRDTTTGEHQQLTARYVVISSGAIETPKLLLRSKTVDWPNGIGNQNDLVGRYFITHPYFFFKATLPKNPLKLQPQMGFPTLVSRHYDSDAEQSKGKFILIHPTSSPKVNLAQDMANGKPAANIEKSIGGPVTVQLQGLIEVFSDRENRVLNSEDSKNNRFGLPQTFINYKQPPGFNSRMEELRNVVAGIFGAMNAENTLIDMPVSWRADHAACTTRMSADEKNGVVDKDLKIFGVDNLYVCSNAVFSSLGAVNPTLTLTALSLRLGEHLAAKLNSQP